MIKGGYKIIDFKDTPFETGGATMIIEGIYDTVEASYRKPLLLSGLTIDGIERNDVFATPTLSGSNYVFNVYGKTIVISDVDGVNIKGTFTVRKEGVTYSFYMDKGMKWSEFVVSDYNTEGLAVSGNAITFGTGYSVDKDNVKVQPADVIVAETNYTTVFEN